MKERLEEIKADTSGWVCRRCQCTNDHACEGGCYWVKENLCSKCDEALRAELEEAISHPGTPAIDKGPIDEIEPTTAEIPVDQVLDAAKDRDLRLVIIVGAHQDGQLFFASSTGDGHKCFYKLHELALKIMMGEFSVE